MTMMRPSITYFGTSAIERLEHSAESGRRLSVEASMDNQMGLSAASAKFAIACDSIWNYHQDNASAHQGPKAIRWFPLA